MSAPIRVLVVDDSTVVRRLVTGALGTDAELEVVGQAADGHAAIAAVDRLLPDVVTLDIEMPDLDGLGALAGIRARHPRLPVIMFSTLTERGAVKTLEALSLGASDYVTKPANVGSVAESVASVREQLIPKIKALAGVRRLAGGDASAPRTPRAAARATRSAARPDQAAPGTYAGLVIGCSTGGPDALTTVVEGLGALPVPALVVQHMPPLFTTMFAQRLDRAGALRVREAGDGDAVVAGQMLLAPGDHHLRLRRDAAGAVRAHLDQGPQQNFCRPAVDPLFESAAEVWDGAVLAVVLTGMGQDGLAGCERVRAAGGTVVVQDEATSVVWGMPGAVAGAGLADEVLPLAALAGRLRDLLTPAPPARGRVAADRTADLGTFAPSSGGPVVPMRTP